MPRMLVFDLLEPGTHSWYEDVETGAVVKVPAGTQIPARRVFDPEVYVVNGLARLEGEDDGTLGDSLRLERAMRTAIQDVKPMEGDPSTWTLDGMLGHIARVRQAEADDRRAFADAEATSVPNTPEEIAAADAAAESTTEVAGGGGTPTDES
jgi:hypothetical protein